MKGTNKPLNEWGKVLHDEDMAAAILDRVLERGRFIHLDGPSGRTRHLNLQEILPAGADRARISGIDVPEFPEPTPLLSAAAIRPYRCAILVQQGPQVSNSLVNKLSHLSEMTLD